MKKSKKYLSLKSIFFMLFVFFSFFVIKNSVDVNACSGWDTSVSVTASIEDANAGTVPDPGEACIGFLSSSTKKTISVTNFNEAQYDFIRWERVSDGKEMSTELSFTVTVKKKETNHNYIARVKKKTKLTFTSSDNATANASEKYYSENTEINLNSEFSLTDGYTIVSYVVNGTNVTDKGALYVVGASDVTIGVIVENNGKRVTFVNDEGSTITFSYKYYPSGETIILSDIFFVKVGYKFINYVIRE